jgi:hypothetical protein
MSSVLFPFENFEGISSLRPSNRQSIRPSVQPVLFRFARKLAQQKRKGWRAFLAGFFRAARFVCFHRHKTSICLLYILLHRQQYPSNTSIIRQSTASNHHDDGIRYSSHFPRGGMPVDGSAICVG